MENENDSIWDELYASPTPTTASTDDDDIWAELYIEPAPEPELDTDYTPEELSSATPEPSIAPAEEDDSWQITKGVQQGWQQLEALGGGLAAVVGDVVGSESLSDWGLETYQKNMEEAKEFEGNVMRYEDIESAEDAFDYAMHGIGTVLPMFVPSLLSGGVGAVIAKRVVQQAVTKHVAKSVAAGMAAKEAAKLAAKEITKKAAQRGAVAGAFSSSAGMQTGSIYGEIYEETGEKHAGVALSFGALTGALDAIPMVNVLEKLGFGKMAKEAISKSIAKEAATFMGKQMLIEGGTEMLQTIGERAAIKWVDENKDIFTEEGWSQIKNAGILGALGGGALAAPSVAIDAMSRPKGIPGVDGPPVDPTNMPIQGDIAPVEGIPPALVDDFGNPIVDPNALDMSTPPGMAPLPETLDMPGPEVQVGEPQPVVPVQVTPVAEPQDTLDTVNGPTVEGGDALDTVLADTTTADGIQETQDVEKVDALVGVINELAGINDVEPSAPAAETTQDTEIAANEVTAELEALLDEKQVEIQQAHDNMDMALKEDLIAEAMELEFALAETREEAAATTTPEVEAKTPTTTAPERDAEGRTEAQKEAGNYKKIHKTVQGLDISVENDVGSVRSGTDAAGKPWSVKMKNQYGYIKRTEGADGDQIDVFMGPNEASDNVFIVDQVDPATGKFDEHKVVLGATTRSEATKIYKANYAKGWKGQGAITQMTMEEFKTWSKEGDTKSPVDTKKLGITSIPLSKIKLERKVTKPDGKTVTMTQTAAVAIKNVDKKRETAKQILRCVNG